MKNFALGLIFLCYAIATFAAPNVKKLSETITDDYIVPPSSIEADYEELVNKWYENTYLGPAPEIDPKTIVNPTDEIYIERLQYLQNEGGFVIEMPYNSVVKKYIEMYTSKRSKLVEKILGLWPYYEPIFEAAFIKEGIPTELKYLSIIESALNPNAVSPAAAAGLWQFIPSTGRGMGLEINSLVDERRDTYKATQKAAEFLHQLYNTYGDWSLAIAAYNCGPGNVNKAMRRSGGKDFWEIYNYLPKETRGYVPAFIAAAYSMNFHNEHGIGASIAKKPLLTDTVKVYKRVTFKQISENANIDIDAIKILNPQYLKQIIPASTNKPYSLILPSKNIYAYIQSEADINEATPCELEDSCVTNDSCTTDSAERTDLTNYILDDYITPPSSYTTSCKEIDNEWYESAYIVQAPKIDTETLVEPTDDIYIERLQYLQNEGGFVIEMPYNSVVKKYIEMYTSKRSKLIEKMLGLWPYYEHIFEAAFLKEGIPTELKYLPIIESALNPESVSTNAATGLWQLIPSTGKGMGLEINSLVDERRDTYKATQKAAEFLHQLYKTYGDWTLAIAAYNCGPGNVNKAIRRSGGKDFWEIYNYLPKETRGYVPAFISMAYVMNFHNEHGIRASLAKKPLVTDSVNIYKRVTFEQISEYADVDIEAIKILNTQYLKQIIPGSPDKPYTLILPAKNIYRFLQYESSIPEERPRSTAIVGEKRTKQKKQDDKPQEANPDN